LPPLSAADSGSTSGRIEGILVGVPPVDFTPDAVNNVQLSKARRTIIVRTNR